MLLASVKVVYPLIKIGGLRVALEAIKEEKLQIPMPIPMPKQKNTARPTILLIEDDEDIAFLLSSMLSREGFEVLQAANGHQALLIIDELPPPKLVLTDVMLPYIDGVQLIAHIRKKSHWHNVPIIMLTAKSQKHDVVRGLNAGANDYVPKPFDPKELMARLRQFLV